jgi:hypothetical protein
MPTAIGTSMSTPINHLLFRAVDTTALSLRNNSPAWAPSLHNEFHRHTDTLGHGNPNRIKRLSRRCPKARGSSSSALGEILGSLKNVVCIGESILCSLSVGVLKTRKQVKPALGNSRRLSPRVRRVFESSHGPGMLLGSQRNRHRQPGICRTLGAGSFRAGWPQHTAAFHALGWQQWGPS